MRASPLHRTHIVLGLSLLGLASVSEGSIVANGGFESPDQNGGYGPSDNWSLYVGNGQSTPGGARSVGGELTPDYGRNIGFVNLPNPADPSKYGSAEAGLLQNLTITPGSSDSLQPGGTYTLSVDVGRANYGDDAGEDFAHTYFILFVDGGPSTGYTAFATPTIDYMSNVPSGGYEHATFTFTVPSDYSGTQARVALLADNSPGYSASKGYTQVNFDNVAITPAPEPASIGVLSVAAVGLLSRRRRRI